jgi:MFS family permease
VLFALFITAGQAVFAFGASVSSIPLILIGRVIFGLGGENMTVALSTLLADWFRGKEMAFAMGLFVALARLGSVFNNFASRAYIETPTRCTAPESLHPLLL